MLHIDRLTVFIIQDILFGYVWLFYRFPEDIYHLYGEMSKSFYYDMGRAIFVFDILNAERAAEK